MCYLTKAKDILKSVPTLGFITLLHRTLFSSEKCYLLPLISLLVLGDLCSRPHRLVPPQGPCFVNLSFFLFVTSLSLSLIALSSVDMNMFSYLKKPHIHTHNPNLFHPICPFTITLSLFFLSQPSFLKECLNSGSLFPLLSQE